MKRFVSYLYTYERGIKGKNIGFIKTDIRNTACRMEIHIRGLGRYEGQGRVYMLTIGEEGVEIGEIAMKSGAGSAYISCALEDFMQSGQEFDDMVGVAMKFGRQYYALSCWKDVDGEDYVQGTFRVREAHEPELLQSETPQSETHQPEVHQPEERQSKEEQELILPEPQTTSDMKTATPTDEPLNQKEQPEEQQILQEEPQRTAENVSEIRQDNDDEKINQEYTNGKDMEMTEKTSDIKKIDVNAIHSLPKRNWYLCNNSFLIHGYLNYRYLILKKVMEEGREKLYLGVPGIYEKPERVMATLFGFPEFLDEKKIQQGFMDESDVAEGTFGYWLCLLDT